MLGANARAKSDYYDEGREVEFMPAFGDEIDWASLMDAIRAEMPTAAHAEAINEQLLLDCIVIELAAQGVLDGSATEGWAS